MRKLILQEFISVDGFAADAQGSTGFFEFLGKESGREVDTDLLQFIGTIDTILLGANTYKMFKEYWPSATTKEELVADALNSTSKIVFSKTLQEAPWGNWQPAVIVSSDAAKAVKELKKQPGKDMVLWGSLSLAQSLLQEKLIDEVQLRVCPVALGSGKPLFKAYAMLDLPVQAVKVYKNSVVLLTYRPHAENDQIHN